MSNKASNKRRLDCEGMIALFEFLDKRQIKSSLPKFYAADLRRVSRIMPTDVDCATGRNFQSTLHLNPLKGGSTSDFFGFFEQKSTSIE